MAIEARGQIEGIQDEVIRQSIPVICDYLQNILGQKLVAYLSGLKDQKMVGRWIQEKARPSDDRAVRLRYAYLVTRLLEQAYGSETTKSWFLGMNSYLGDEAPASVLRRATTIDEARPVYVAARIFLGMA